MARRKVCEKVVELGCRNDVTMRTVATAKDLLQA